MAVTYSALKNLNQQRAMSLSDDTFDLYIREKQLMLSATAIWLTEEAREAENMQEQNKLLDHVWNCHNADLLLQQYIDYRWTAEKHLNEARLEVVKLRISNQELVDEVHRLRKIIEDNL